MTGARQLAGDPFEAQRLDGRVLVVPGGTQGLGAAIAELWDRLHGAAGNRVATAQPGASA